MLRNNGNGAFARIQNARRLFDDQLVEILSNRPEGSVLTTVVEACEGEYDVFRPDPIELDVIDKQLRSLTDKGLIKRNPVGETIEFEPTALGKRIAAKLAGVQKAPSLAL